MRRPRIFVINPGSTSTKVAFFRGARAVFETTLTHQASRLRKFPHINDQAGYREGRILAELRRHGVPLESIDMFAARGGLLHPLAGGIYAVNAAMLADLHACRYGEHACNLGAIMASRLAAGGTARVYIANPVVVDELAPEARITGHPDVERRSIFHALNQKAVAGKVAGRLGRPYGRCRLIVAHIGGGISIGVHRNGKVVDVNNALEGDGPFSPERTGSLPALALLRHVEKHRLSARAAAEMVTRGGGLYAHLGTNDCREIVHRISRGSRRDRLVMEAFVYQVAKAIGAGAAALAGRVDGVALTGNVMKCAWVRSRLRRMVRFIAPVFVLAGSLEMEALAQAALSVCEGRKRARTYQPHPTPDTAPAQRRIRRRTA